MSKLGFVLAVDGIYGPDSERGCRDFLTQRRLHLDGEVGPETWTAAFASPGAGETLEGRRGHGRRGV